MPTEETSKIKENFQRGKHFIRHSLITHTSIFLSNYLFSLKIDVIRAKLDLDAFKYTVRNGGEGNLDHNTIYKRLAKERRSLVLWLKSGNFTFKLSHYPPRLSVCFQCKLAIPIEA
jgi:hypothetical protein